MITRYAGFVAASRAEIPLPLAGFKWYTDVVIVTKLLYRIVWNSLKIEVVVPNAW